MTSGKPGRMIILAGPSCVGKSPLARALSRLHPQIWNKLDQLVLYNDRDPRPGEQDGIQYHFRSRGEIRDLEKRDDFLVLEVRADLQALDLRELHHKIQQGDVFFEGNPYIAGRLLETPTLAGVEKLSIFMSPLTQEEIQHFLSLLPEHQLPELVQEIMRRKLLRRTRRLKGRISISALEDIEIRSAAAYRELRQAHRYQYVLPNHDGEDSENWEAFPYPVGDARQSLQAFLSLLGNHQPSGVEKWDRDLLPVLDHS